MTARRSEDTAGRLADSIERLASALERLGNSIERLAKAIERLAMALERLAMAIDRLANAIDRLAKAFVGLADRFAASACRIRACRCGMTHAVGKEVQAERSDKSAAEIREEAWIRCSACGHGLAPARARIDVEGKHVHTFVNPAGFEFTIRCFGDVPGCTRAGEESTFWSWFRGFAWRMAACGGCAAHVGWSFRKDASVFWGLVADRITG